MLGKVLVDKKIIDEEQLSEALKAQTKYRELLGRTLVKLGHCLEEDVARAIAEIYKLPYMELEEIDVKSKATQYIPANLALRYNIASVKVEGDILYLACARPLSPQIVANLQRLTNKQIAFYIAADSTVGSLLKEHYKVDSDSMEEELTDEAIDQSVIDILDDHISRALRQKASDIHFEPQETKVRIRFRIDGVLREIGFLPTELAPPVISRIKILSGLNIAEKRAPQDGSFVFKYLNESIDIRVSTLPNVNGEKAVLRLLPSKRRIITLETLGMEKNTLKTFGALIKRPHGIILITGPTGSGKSTTLYASLLLIRSAGINITTIEDPVEYHIDGITQTQVDHVNKITFPKALRHILRQDPDVIMVGEIRDKETADISLRAALTGHLVFSTLHTNDASGALTRLIDMGCEPFFVSSTVCAIIAQRLLRLNCEFCKEPFTPTQDELRMWGLKDVQRKRQWFRAPGCRRCQKTGYSGRVGIFEMLKVDGLIQKEIIKNSSVGKIKEAAVSCGMRTLRQEAFLKVESGLTSPEEALRVTALD